jgi:glycosyltransferase involved in cell wall biosynthesis
MSDRLISIILPVHNQADHIGPIVRGYLQELAKLRNPHEIILVLNGCRDQSPAVCQQLAQEHPTVRVAESPRAGWGRAVRLGLQEARGDVVCYTNSARTTAHDLVLLVFYAVVYPDAVIKANRKIRESWRRRLGSLLYNLECRALFSLPQWDINGTPKVFPRQFARLRELAREDDLIDLEFNVVCRQEEYPMLEVPILATQRHGGKSTTNFRSALRMYWGAYRMWRSRRGGTA